MFALKTVALLFGGYPIIVDAAQNAHQVLPRAREAVDVAHDNDGDDSHRTLETYDECTGGIAIPSLPYQLGGTTAGSTADFDSASCGATADANGVWFSYTPATTKEMTASINAGLGIRIYSGEDCNDLTCVSNSDIMQTFVGVANVEYKFLISSLGTSFDFVLNVEEVPNTGSPSKSPVTPEPTGSPTKHGDYSSYSTSGGSSSVIETSRPTTATPNSTTNATTPSPTIMTTMYSSKDIGMMEVPEISRDSRDDHDIPTYEPPDSDESDASDEDDEDEDCPESSSMSYGGSKSAKAFLSKSPKHGKKKSNGMCMSMTMTSSKSEKSISSMSYNYYGYSSRKANNNSMSYNNHGYSGKASSSDGHSMSMVKSEKASRKSKSSKSKCGKALLGGKPSKMQGKASKSESTTAQMASQFKGSRYISKGGHLSHHHYCSVGVLVLSWMMGMIA